MCDGGVCSRVQPSEDIKKGEVEKNTAEVLARAALRVKDIPPWGPTPPDLCGGRNESCHPVAGCCRGYNCIDGFCTCKRIGDLCRTTSDCCWDTMCDGGVCSRVQPCQEAGDDCFTSKDCCGNGICEKRR